MTQNFKGKTALVTGATRGIGRAIAERLVGHGARVIITGTKKKGCPPEGCEYRAVDFTDLVATQTFVNEVAGWEVDILINNAGTNKISSFTEVSLNDFMRIQQVNLVAPFLLCKAVIPNMKSKHWGRIVNISSIWGKISKEQRAAYSASKFGLDGMTAALAAEVAQHGILANCVAPGFINTELTRSILGDAGMKAIAAGIPVKRLGTPEEIAAFVVWLSGPENTYISGQNIAVDGGFTRV